MHRALTARWLNRALRIGEAAPSAGVPVYLCPIIGRFSSLSTRPLAAVSKASHGGSISQRRGNHVHAAPVDTPAHAAEVVEPIKPLDISQPPSRSLPLTCSGCGAFTQTTDPHQFGYLDLESKRVGAWMRPKAREERVSETGEDQVVDEALKALDQDQLKELGLTSDHMVLGEEGLSYVTSSPAPDKEPICERCHNLMHYSTTTDSAKLAMHHPTIDTLRETIEESPHKYNHIYHIIDAADFPMSLVPRLNVLLGDIPMRTQNRRSRAYKFYGDRKMEISFIITRGDLLGPTKNVVDSMMPYLREVLRDALGRLGERVRLGNVRCVSAKRGWWTKQVKEDIWTRGGAGWMIGKVNVGKSQLFESVYPKGRMTVASKSSGDAEPADSTETPGVETAKASAARRAETQDDFELGDLLPPLRPEANYPDMPVVSPLPGTTASPIRVPFGSGKGELIDLPGLARSDLEQFVKEEHRQSLVMRKRVIPEQLSIKQGTSVLLGGGLIRITPRTPNLTFLMYNFTPIEEHVTMDEKAIGFQDQTRQSPGVPNITTLGTGDCIKHAGMFKLRYDVTKKRAGPLTRKNAVGLRVDRLHFRVLSIDILIEGVGYVEIVAQVRARDVEQWSKAQPRLEERPEREVERKPKVVSDDPFADMVMNRKDAPGSSRPAPRRREVEREPEPEPEPEPDWPAVDVYTPEGRFVGSRPPINGWLNNKPRVLAVHKKTRPRKSMKGEKKQAKIERRAGGRVQESE